MVFHVHCRCWTFQLQEKITGSHESSESTDLFATVGDAGAHTDTVFKHHVPSPEFTDSRRWPTGYLTTEGFLSSNRTAGTHLVTDSLRLPPLCVKKSGTWLLSRRSSVSPSPNPIPDRQVLSCLCHKFVVARITQLYEKTMRRNESTV